MGSFADPLLFQRGLQNGSHEVENEQKEDLEDDEFGPSFSANGNDVPLIRATENPPTTTTTATTTATMTTTTMPR